MSILKCILIIDDDEISNFLTKRTIMTEGLATRVEAATNGEEGLNKLKDLYQNSNNGIPELILLDVKMPVLDGFGFLKKFHDLEMANKPSVVMLSSSTNSTDMSRAKEFNIRGYLKKPLSADELRHLLNHDN